MANRTTKEVIREVAVKYATRCANMEPDDLAAGIEAAIYEAIKASADNSQAIYVAQRLEWSKKNPPLTNDGIPVKKGD